MNNLKLALAITACTLALQQAGAEMPQFPPDNTNLCFFSFSDTNTWINDCGSSPLGFTNLSWSNLGDGPALVVDSTNPAWLNFACIDTNGWTNLTVGTGSVVLWYAPFWSSMSAGGTGPGNSARLLQVGEYTPDASYGFWGISIDPEGSNVCFSAQGNDGSQLMYLSAPISWSTNRWHQLVLTYSAATNCALYIDGAFATNGPATTVLPSAAVQSRGFFLGSDTNGCSQMAGMMDDVATCNYPLDAVSIASMYDSSGFVYYVNPMNEANIVQLTSAPSYVTNTPTFRAVMGPGFLSAGTPLTNCISSTNVWMTNIAAFATASNTMALSFSVQGGDPSLLYDVYATADLMLGSITNAQWYWMGQVSPCNRYTLSNLPPTTVQVVLGSPQDDDLDGLPNAFEGLVSKTDPENPSTFGSGLLDGWLYAYYGSAAANVDPYSLCPSGDGWTLFQASQKGWDPKRFYTPPPPRHVIAQLDSTGTNVIVTWQYGGGPVTNYTVSNSLLGTYSQVDSNTFSFTDNVVFYDSGPKWLSPYVVTAWFTNGSHADSEPTDAFGGDLNPNLAVVRGPGGQLYLTLSPVPSDLGAVRIYWYNWDPQTGGADYHTYDISVTNLQTGIAQLPLSLMPIFGGSLSAQCIGTNGDFGMNIEFQLQMSAERLSVQDMPFNFLNAQVQIKENLRFLLRSATENVPFSYASDLDLTLHQYGGPLTDHIEQPESYFVRPPTSTNYEYYGFHTFSPNLGYSFMNELRPVEDNFIWRNFAFDPGTWTPTGVQVWLAANSGERDVSDLQYMYGGSGTESPLPLALTNSSVPWLFYGAGPVQDESLVGEFGCVGHADGSYSVLNGTLNCFGLPLQSVVIGSNSEPAFEDLSLGSPFPSDYTNSSICYFPYFGAPSLQPVSAYLASQTAHFNYNGTPPEPMPGSPDFSMKSNLGLHFTGVGQPITISAWFIYAVSNNYNNKFAFLEQYFDKAYQLDSNGNTTTNQTGLLSEYGEFFPSEPGTAALNTKTDIDPPYSYTRDLVTCVKLQLDVNHDLSMDTSFAGPDNTSPSCPYVFWVNDDYDRVHEVGPDLEQDDVASTDKTASCPYTNAPTPDCEYRNLSGNRVIPSQRDLEDFARLWVSGISTNIMSILPSGVTGELSWGDKGNPNSSNPTIDLFAGADDGGSGYLTNVDTAFKQTDSVDYPWVDRLGPGQSITVFSNSWVWRHFIWCGVKPGAGALTLRVMQGSNVLAESSVDIVVKNIKEMYERYTVGDDTNAPASSARLAEDGVDLPFQYGPPSSTNTPYILLVPDYDAATWQKDRYAETAFKRLYWQGYQGRFGLFCWPGINNTVAFPLCRSESNAWASATGLLNVLSNLNVQYPGNVYLIAHGYGAIATGEALRLAGTNYLVNTYISMQGAVASHAYDPTAPIRSLGSSDSGTPNLYAEYYTNGPLPYFAGVAGAGSYVNYFNTNDWLLTGDGGWRAAQNGKPDLLLEYRWNGTNFLKGFSVLVIPANTYDIFAFCDQARCDAIGAQANLGLPFISGAQLDLGGPQYTFTSKQKDHSGQFLSYSAYRWQIWQAIMKSLGL